MEVITDFGTPQFLAIDTFTTGVYRTWFLLHDKYPATVLAVAELIFITTLITVEKILQKRGSPILQSVLIQTTTTSAG